MKGFGQRSLVVVVAVALMLGGVGCISLGSTLGISDNVFKDYTGEYETTKVVMSQAEFVVQQPTTRRANVVRLQEASQRATDTLVLASKASDAYGEISRQIAVIQASGEAVPPVMLQNARAAKFGMRVWIPRIKADRLNLEGALVGGLVP